MVLKLKDGEGEDGGAAVLRDAARALDKRWREDFAPTANKAIFCPNAKDLATRLQVHVRAFCRSYATCSDDDDTTCSAPEGHVA